MEVSKESDGPWWKVLEKKTLQETTVDGVTPYKMTFTTDTVFARYVKFTCIENYEDSCALQYFSAV